jgi:hypothetical protein
MNCGFLKPRLQEPDSGVREQHDELDMGGQQEEEPERMDLEDPTPPPADIVTPPADIVAPPDDIVAPPDDIVAALRATTEADAELASGFTQLLRSKSRRGRMSDYDWVQIYQFAVEFNAKWFQQRMVVQVFIYSYLC